VLFLAIIDNGLNLMGLNYLVKDALVGVILVVALALPSGRRACAKRIAKRENDGNL
jgi:ribose/xylose/arabinose/galactoside ABC-type transport system permease subunit